MGCQLLNVEPENRLGADKKLQNIKDHDFFKGIDHDFWEKLANQEYASPLRLTDKEMHEIISKHPQEILIDTEPVKDWIDTLKGSIDKQEKELHKKMSWKKWNEV